MANSRKLQSQSQYNISSVDRLIMEGDGLGTNANFAVVTTFPSAGLQSGAGFFLGNLILVPTGKAVWIESITISSNKSAWFQIQTGNGFDSGLVTGIGNFATNNNLTPIVGAGGGSVTIPVRQFAKGSYKTTATGGSVINVWCRQVFDADLTNCSFSGFINGIMVTDDFNVSADNVILWKGDSISAGTGITGFKNNMLSWKVRQRFMLKGINCRLLNKSYGGTTSKFFDYQREAGLMDFEQVDFIFYQLGANDASQNTTALQYRANIEKEISYNLVRYPRAKQIYLGTTPLNNNAAETLLATFRTEMSNAVTAANNPNVMYCNLGTSFDRTVLSNYWINDGTHPNDANHALMYNVLDTFLTSKGL